MSQESCFEKLEQLINDENRIVTYKILSREMKIHVNKAKEYLNLFYEEKKADPNASLVAHYLLAGFFEQKDMGLVKVLIIPEDKLGESKLEFRELTSLHVYSVSRIKLKDECALYTTDASYNRNAEEVEKYSAIKHPSIKIQAPSFKVDFIKTDTKSSVPKVQSVNLDNGSLTPVPQKIENKTEKVAVNEESNEKLATGSATSTSSNMKGNASTENSKKNTLASLWQKKEEKPSTEKKMSKSEDKAKKGAVKSVSKNNIMNMFSKQAEKNILSGKKEDSPSSAKEEKTIAHKIEIVEKSSPTTSKNSNSQSTKSPKKKKSTKRQQSKKSKHESDSDSGEELKPKKKKHRRICTFDDSDSDSENEEMQDKAQRNLLNSPDEIFTPAVASDDSEEPIPPTPPVRNAVKIKGKVWKTVQKTYQDDDGFFVTKKEKELVTASEESDEDPLKPNVKELPARNSPSKTAHAAKKQASLTSYFNRK